MSLTKMHGCLDFNGRQFNGCINMNTQILHTVPLHTVPLHTVPLQSVRL